jgi:hypothetical protein
MPSSLDDEWGKCRQISRMRESGVFPPVCPRTVLYYVNLRACVMEEQLQFVAAQIIFHILCRRLTGRSIRLMVENHRSGLQFLGKSAPETKQGLSAQGTYIR